MLDNYPVVRREFASQPYHPGERFWTIDPVHDAEMQMKAVRNFVADGGMRRYLGSPDAPIVCVRGNHDFIDIGALFDGCNLVHEFVSNELIDINGFKVTGHRGIPFIYGTWNDEVRRPELLDRVRAMPDDCDLYLTHYPAKGLLDTEVKRNGAVESYGLDGMAEVLLQKMKVSSVHCFGHIHGSMGVRRLDSMVFSNAATGVNTIDI